jgi:hypothetical protein
MGCHLGREVGGNVLTDIDADGVRSFINSHYLAAGANIFNESGYEYAGQSYDSFGFHKQVGISNTYLTGTDGPCVTCHMTSDKQHSFEVVTKDIAGVITAVASTECAKCHGGLTAAVMETSKSDFHLALEELRLALFAKGIEFSAAYPYFYEAGTTTAFTNWAGVYGAAEWKNVMGAAFNYNLLEHDPGAYAHNRDYALKLIQDSIDYLADGAVNGVGTSTVVAGIMASTTFAEDTTWTAAGHPGDTLSCTICHSAASSTLSAGHAPTGKVVVSNQAVSTNGTDVTMTFNVKVDGVNADNFTVTPAGYWYKASVDADGFQR